MTNKFQFFKTQKFKPGFIVFISWFLEFGDYLFFDV